MMNMKDKIKFLFQLNYGEETEYYLNIYMIDKLVIDTGIKNTYTYTVQYLLHEDTEYPKVCNLYDGNLYAASSVVNMQSTKVSKINNEGKPIYGNATINVGYTPDANLIQPYNMDYYILTHHNKQNLQGQSPKENILTLKDLYLSKNFNCCLKRWKCFNSRNKIYINIWRTNNS